MAGDERETSFDETDEKEVRSEQGSSSDEADKRDPEPQSSPPRKYLFQQINPPKILTYNTLGQPSVTRRHN